MFRDLKIHRLSLYGGCRRRESNPNEGGSWSAVTGPLEVKKSARLRETERAGGRRKRKEQGSLEDRNRTSGEEENRGREGKTRRVGGRRVWVGRQTIKDGEQGAAAKEG